MTVPFLFLEIPQLATLDQLKQRVMDTTMNYIGTLASYMGYAWSSGCWAKRVGEDFRKKGDTWESTYREGRCELKGGPKKDVRLKITYENFAFTMKDVKFGKSIKPPITLDQEQQLMTKATARSSQTERVTRVIHLKCMLIFELQTP